ncbi:unnamed protein product [Rotaria sordida]|uniref:Vitellogenin receptor n=1 Tax=Rotaria sordida TaxID=392033 RepID=A0A813ZHG1_9BILA|nr:unnamed protein product [Rotaria sordida]CAF0899481.1 unnamed protein product [Rotaria sordida]
MAFATLVLKEMIIKSTAFLILIHLVIIKTTRGYLGCPLSLVPCLNKTHCINIEKVCVGNNKCVDEQGKSICHYCPTHESDLIACVTHIESHLSFDCLSPHQICDNIKDCHNNEDEHLCDIKKCKFGFGFCANGTCIENSRICDGKKDCPDGSDEGAHCPSISCEPDKIHCPTGECIQKSKMCDGAPDCSDGYDEQNCTHLTSTVPNLRSISSNTFTCSSSLTLIQPITISNDRVCDGYKDCPMGDDERDCTDECTSKSICITNVNVTCIQHRAVDKLCRCTKQGYRLTKNSLKNNTQICQDFNECNDSLRTYCSFNCLNTDGSFNCTCPLGFAIDENTKICRKINNQSKANLLILFDNNIILYNILNNTDHYLSKLLNTTDLTKTHHFDRIQYDSNGKFVIYYDQIQSAILCFSTLTTIIKPIVLISNVIVQDLAYNENEKTLFIIENQSQTLRMYTPITCDIPFHIKMHSWQLNNISNSIQSIVIDVFNRQIIFSSPYQFMKSNMSQPNSTKVLYTSDREIKRFIYDASFKRIFWTVTDVNNSSQFPVHTCDSEFKQCHDTSIRLPFAWPFAFFNDGLLYSSSSLQSLDIIQLYGNNRFSNNFITSTREHIRSFLPIDNQPVASVNLCENYSKTRCENKLCLQINSTEINCLSIDENIITKQLITSTTSTTSSTIQSETQSVTYNDHITEAADQRKNYRYRPRNTILFLIIAFTILAAILAIFVKRCQASRNQRALPNQQNNNEQSLSTEDPNLDEFTVTFDDRIMEQSADNAGDRLPLTDYLHY